MDKPLTKKQRREQRKQTKQQPSSPKGKPMDFWIGMFIFVVIVIIGVKIFNPMGEDVPEITERFYGNANAEVVLTEYSDFECPACASYQPMIKEIKEEFKDDLKVVYKNFPLRTIHPNAQIAAQAAEAAGQQGMFWEMHDVLFEKQREWSEFDNPEGQFATYAEELGLDGAQFSKDLTSKAVKNKITADIADATRLNVSSTPSFYINDTKIDNPRSVDDLRNIIKSYLPAEEPETPEIVEETTTEEANTPEETAAE